MPEHPVPGVEGTGDRQAGRRVRSPSRYRDNERDRMKECFTSMRNGSAAWLSDEILKEAGNVI